MTGWESAGQATETDGSGQPYFARSTPLWEGPPLHLAGPPWKDPAVMLTGGLVPAIPTPGAATRPAGRCGECC